MLYMDLLSDNSEQRYSKNPDLIISDALASKKEWIIIDEIQKIPKLMEKALINARTRWHR